MRLICRGGVCGGEGGVRQLKAPGEGIEGEAAEVVGEAEHSGGGVGGREGEGLKRAQRVGGGGGREVAEEVGEGGRRAAAEVEDE